MYLFIFIKKYLFQTIRVHLSKIMFEEDSEFNTFSEVSWFKNEWTGWSKVLFQGPALGYSYTYLWG